MLRRFSLPALSTVLLPLALFPLNLCAQGSSDSCAAASAIGIGVTSYSTTAATTDGPLSCALIGNDVWFLFTAPNTGSWKFDLCASTNYDAAMAIYPDTAPCPPSDGDEIGCNDDACGGGGPPVIVLGLLAGDTVRLQVGGWSSAVGTGEIFISEVPPLPADADILVGEISTFTQFGREGSEVGCGLLSVTCNAGAEPLDWFGNPDPRHPFITSATYRLEGDRLMQIGMSFAKHGFSAAQADGCSLGCTPFPNGTRLGSGCSDTYGAGTNANQSNLGPRSEVDPWTGDFDFATSALGGGPFDGVERRLRMQDDDLDVSQHPGAEWICEVYVLAHDDSEHTNSIAWQPFVPNGTPGGTWSFDTSATTTVGAAIAAWPGATIAEVMDPALDDGRVYLAAKVIDLGNGTWRYEYAIQNLDLAGGIGTLSVPATASVTITDIGFHAANQFEPGFDDQPWSTERTADSVLWSTDPEAAATPQNPLRWGALYNFWFTADFPPVPADLTMGVHFVTTTPTLGASSVGPEGTPPGVSFRRGDVNVDGLLDIADPVFDLGCLFRCFPSCRDAHDSNDDGAWNIADPVYTLNYLFQQGPQPSLPWPGCGIDETLSMLDCQSYPGCP